MDPNPQDPAAWHSLIEALQPAAMLLRVESRMSPALKQRLSAEDIWQETLLCAWRDRAQLDWRGLPAFRQWLMEIAENRIRDATDRFSAAKRDTLREHPLGSGARHSDPGSARVPLDFTAQDRTPPSVAIHVERAQAMREALDALPEIYREVLRLRLFEEWERERIAQHLGLSIPAVKHRIRLGAALYREKLALVMSSRRSAVPAMKEPDPEPDR